MAEVPGSGKTYKAQMILLAMGFHGPEKYVLDQLELAKDGRGNIKTPAGQYATNIPGVFAAGDCRRGQFGYFLFLLLGILGAKGAPLPRLCSAQLAFVLESEKHYVMDKQMDAGYHPFL